MKIFKFNEFLNEAVSIPQVIDDFVTLMEEQPVIEMYPEDEGDVVREGWITKEHKMYSSPGIKRYFKNKYGSEYSSTNINNAYQYDPNIRILTKKLADKGMTLQTTPVKGQYGETSWFYSVNLTDEERNQIKSKYEAEFAKRYANYFAKKALARRPIAPVKRRGKKGGVSEALELLIESLFNLNEEKKWIKDAIKKPGALRKSMGKEKGEKITKGEINDEISKLKKKDKDKEKPGLQLSDRDKTKYKRLTLAKTLKEMK